MSKIYFTTRNLTGDQPGYYIDTTTSRVIGATCVEHATKIAFNGWLEAFDNHGHSADNVQILADGFSVDVHSKFGPSRTERHVIVWHGPCGMFTPQFKIEHSDDVFVQRAYAAMAAAHEAGSPSVKRNKRGMVVFADDSLMVDETDPEREWAGTYKVQASQGGYLSTDSHIARLQLAAAGIVVEEAVA